MESINEQFPWLELIDRPAFCVKGGIVIAVNAAAENRMLRLGTDVRQIVTEHRDTYETFESGRLYLTIQAGGLPCNACVDRTKECDIFIIDQDSDDRQLQALALAAQQLRIPLSNVMTVADRLLVGLDKEDPDIQRHTKQINQGLFQLLRIISNMSDAGSYQDSRASGIASVNLTAVFDEIIEKVSAIAADTGRTVAYTGPHDPVFTLANTEKIERAVYNLFSNALKFSPAGSAIEAKLAKSGNTVTFTVCNPGGSPENAHGFWNCYRREPAIEDSRYGLGLGMTLVSAAATAHGGTVLIDYPSPEQTRVTMTIPIVKKQSSTISSPILRIGDYAGGRDKALLELAEILPTDFYDKIN